MLDQKYIYKFRKEIRKLYEGDIASCNGDIVDMIYDAIDSEYNNFVYSLKTQAYTLSVTLPDNSTTKDVLEVKNIIANCVQQFILDNRDRLDISGDEYDQFNDFISDPSLICDTYCVGKSVQVVL